MVQMQEARTKLKRVIWEASCHHSTEITGSPSAMVSSRVHRNYKTTRKETSFNIAVRATSDSRNPLWCRKSFQLDGQREIDLWIINLEELLIIQVRKTLHVNGLCTVNGTYCDGWY